MADQKAFSEVFRRLRPILEKHVPPLVVTADTDRDYSLAVDLPAAPEPARYFGGVSVKRAYVSVYLMPVYGMPSLLTDASPELLQRMQSKSCFNFTKVDEALFDELAAIADRGVPAYLRALPEIIARRAGRRPKSEAVVARSFRYANQAVVICGRVTAL